MTSIASVPIRNRRAGSRRFEPAFEIVRAWFRSRGWTPFAFQERVWTAYLRGGSGLLHAATGAGKTQAVWLGAVIEGLTAATGQKRRGKTGLQVLWLTPLRALAADTHQALQAPLVDIGLAWTIESRTGDTTPSVRRRQQKRLPETLITTPESLSLFLTHPDASEMFRDLKLVVVDEWHELLSSKRGVQVELALARLARWSPRMRVWGVSATLGNLDEAAETLLRPVLHNRRMKRHNVGAIPEVVSGAITATLDEPQLRRPKIIRGAAARTTLIESVIPPDIQRFPWAGHLGLRLLPQVLPALDSGASTLFFTNTRSQSELWYQAILKARPDWAGLLGLHHGSLDRSGREWVERGLKSGHLRCAVCTSSLDLGVDFSPVDQVVQVGSPKGVARLLQRAGRSGHRPGADSRMLFVPTNALELIEVAAARDAMAAGRLEGRTPVENPIDTLVQHAVTIATGEGFTEQDLFAELKTTRAFESLTREQWRWVLDFITHGGDSLKAYPDYHRVRRDGDLFRVASERIARQHRVQIGTIVGDASLRVKFLTGGRLGTIEESFVAKLKPGDCFSFAGRILELVKVHDMDVLVRAGSKKSGVVPRWMGGRMPLSSELAAAVRDKFDEAAHGVFDGPEMTAVKPLLDVQRRWSSVPARNDLLIERWKSREGHHLYIYPFAGRLVHEGLAALWTYRFSQLRPNTFSMSMNDYGMELVSAHEAAPDDDLPDLLLKSGDLPQELLASLNSVEMARRQFREIARISGLVFDGYGGQRKTAKQLQASSGLLYDVFSKFEPQNLLLGQARREVLERQLEVTRMQRTLDGLRTSRFTIQHLNRPTPLAFPLMVDRLRDRLSSESLADRVQRMTMQLERQADLSR